MFLGGKKGRESMRYLSRVTAFGYYALATNTKDEELETPKGHE